MLDCMERGYSVLTERNMEMDAMCSNDSLLSHTLLGPCPASELSLYPADYSKAVLEDPPKVFTDLKPPLQEDSMPEEDEDDDEGLTIELRCWTMRHLEEWRQNEVLSWLHYLAQQSDEIKLSDLHTENFNNLSGQQLIQMGVADFERLEPKYGHTIFNSFQNLRDKTQYKPPATPDIDLPLIENYNSTQASQTNTWSNDVFNTDTSPNNTEFIDINFLSQMNDEPINGLGQYSKLLYDFESTDRFTDLDPIMTARGPMNSVGDEGYSSTDSSSPPPQHPAHMHHQPSYSSTLLPPISSFSQPIGGPMIPRTVMEEDVSSPPPRRPVGRPPRDGRTTHRGRAKHAHGSKGSHLWEFVRDLLKDHRTNPSIIRWENKQERVFRFVKSETVARLWGDKKNNKTMTYEKLSRAMRFCRTSGFFSDVPKDGNFPKKLCFRFGPKATGLECL